MKLVHFSKKIIKKLKSVTIQRNEFKGKPDGFWVSDEDDYGWKEWSTAEGFRLENLKYPYEIELSDNHNLLMIKNLKEFDEFNREYRLINQYLRDIDWERVVSQYRGIIITPYLWKRRLTKDLGWYYGWDCASGCIWDVKAIKSIKMFKYNV